jgi:nitrogen fixation NifU-like protein
MDDLRDLYQATILDHNKSPRNFRSLEDANRSADGNNPICGDKLTLYVKLDEHDRVEDIGFQGAGCAISTASASLMTERVKGKTVEEIERDFERFHEVVAGNPSQEANPAGLGKLSVFAGVREYPIRVKCATLCWHTLRAALEKSGEVAKTE